MIRPELAAAYNTTHKAGLLDEAILIVPTDNQVCDYKRHDGLLSHFWIDLEGSLGRVLIDTEKLPGVQHAWVGARQHQSLRLVLAAALPDVAVKRHRVVHTFPFVDRLEGIELIIERQYWRKDIPYIDDLRPVYRETAPS